MLTEVAKTIDAQITYDRSLGLYRLSFPAMGTDCQALFELHDRLLAIEFARETTQWVADFETRYSRFRRSSIVSQINRNAGFAATLIDEETARLLDIAEDLYRHSNGLLDPTVLPLIELWQPSAERTFPPSSESIEDCLERVGWPLVHRSEFYVFLPMEGMKLDIGGWGKEYAVDRVAELAYRYNIENFLIDFGRDIRAAGAPPQKAAWKVEVENPQSLDTPQATLYLNTAAVATSGSYRRFVKREGKSYSHIIDPRSGYPVANDTLSSTAIASTCLQAGELATICCLVGSGEGLDRIETALGVEGCVTTKRGVLHSSRFFQYAAHES